VITHYQRLLDYIVPDFVHILADGVSFARATNRWRWASKSKAMMP